MSRANQDLGNMDEDAVKQIMQGPGRYNAIAL